MFREKYNSFSTKRGYLYIRESIYKRDKRTLKKKPSKLGDGTATKERGKYTIKKDTYCGKIYEINIKYILTFEDYLRKEYKDFDFINYKTKSTFDIITDNFIDYLLYCYDLDKEEFFTGKKKVYQINSGYLSKETILWLKRFQFNKNPYSKTESNRFFNRCLDIGIFEEEIIKLLYSKLLPDDIQQEKEEDEKKLEFKRLKLNKYRDFMKQSIKD